MTASRPPAPPLTEDEARVAKCGMRKPGSTATCIEPAGHAGPEGRDQSHGDGSVIRWIYR